MFSPPNLKEEILDVLAPFSIISVFTATYSQGIQTTSMTLINPPNYKFTYSKPLIFIFSMDEWSTDSMAFLMQGIAALKRSLSPSETLRNCRI